MSTQTTIYTWADHRTRTEVEVARPRPRHRALRALRWLYLPGALALLFLGIQNAYPSLSGSGLFELMDIRVVGNTLTDAGTVASQCGLTPGANLFQADLESARQKVVALPIIKDALLVRQPPNRLVISVQERRPIAMVSGPGGLRGMDADGVLFPMPQIPVDLPVVTSASPSDPAQPVPAEGLRNLATFLVSLRAEAPWFLGDISEIHFLTTDEAQVFLVGDGTEVRMRLEEAGQQARAFEALTAAGGYRGPAPYYLDLRFSGQVIVGKRPVETEPATPSTTG